MTAQNDPLGAHWVIAPALSELQPPPRADPVRLSPSAAILLMGLLCLGLWGLIWLLWCFAVKGLP